MWQKSVIFGALLAGVVFITGWMFRLATMRALVIRSLLTATGTILTIVLARKAIDQVTADQQNVEAPLNDLNLGEFIEDEPGESPASTDQADEDTETSQETVADEDMDDSDLQEALEEEVEQGNEEGVEEIADLISDSMDE